MELIKVSLTTSLIPEYSNVSTKIDRLALISELFVALTESVILALELSISLS